MRVSLGWLKDYLALKEEIDVEQISESLTLAGLEVEGVESLGFITKDIKLGIVKKIEKKEEQGIYTLEHDGQEFLVEGIFDKELSLEDILSFKEVSHKPKKTYKPVSYDDISLPAGTGLLISFKKNELKDVPKTLGEVSEYSDTIITLGITPNRADATSHLGVSRELCALLDYNSQGIMLTPKEMSGPTHEKITVEIENSKDCPRYACRLVENIVIKPSPYWIRARLIKSGVRPVNNVVDITNYVMLSRGQPMHGFDYSKLSCDNTRAKIIVRRAKDKESFVALDGKKLSLCSDDIIIADNNNAIALAGVIGGLDSSIDNTTTSVLLESAYFEPKNVRFSSRKYGITTESSYRFERGCDPNGVMDALNYAAKLLVETSEARVCREAIDVYRMRIEPKEVKMRPKRAQDVLGIDEKDFDQALLRKRFLKLGIETSAKRGDAIYFRIPTYRVDLEREIDLIEEAARMIGYDKVSQTTKVLTSTDNLFHDTKAHEIKNKIASLLVSRGFFEAVNYAFLNNQLQDKFLGSTDKDTVIGLQNPLSERYNAMRVSIVPGLIKNLISNQRSQSKSVRLFEFGTTFHGINKNGSVPNPETLSGLLNQDSFCVEKQSLAGVMFGLRHSNAFDIPKSQVDFYDVKGIIAEILITAGISDILSDKSISFTKGSKKVYLHPGQSCDVLYHYENDTITLGSFGLMHPEISQHLDIEGQVFAFEFFLEKLLLLNKGTVRYQPFSRQPHIDRDLAFLFDEAVEVGKVFDLAWKSNGSEILKSINIFDIYRGKNLATNKKSVAFSLTFQSDDKTLTDVDVDIFMKEFSLLVKNEIGGVIRE